MKKNILLPTDFSDNAWSAVIYVLKLYANEECTFHFLHSSKIKVSAMSNLSNKLLEVMAKNAMKELKDLQEMAIKTNVNVNHDFNIILSTEDIQFAIESAVEKYNIDVVVMGTKGATGAKEFFFGSNTVRVIKKMRLCPILVVPDGYYFIKPKNIGFPTDFNRFYGEELVPLKELASLFDSKIRVVSIVYSDKLSDLQDYNMISLKKHLKNFKTQFHCMPDYDKKTVEIFDFIEELNINVLVMINYKHSFIESIIKEPVIKKIGFHPIVPFFVIPSVN